MWIYVYQDLRHNLIQLEPSLYLSATPFKFIGANTTLNTTVNSSRKAFDLKASLARPMTWKPHKGKLKPLDDATKSPIYVKTQVKIEKER